MVDLLGLRPYLMLPTRLRLPIKILPQPDETTCGPLACMPSTATGAKMRVLRMWPTLTRVTRTARRWEKGKARRTFRPRRTGQPPRQAVSSEERQRIIELWAYSRAPQRGFVIGLALHDWLLTETEVDA
jgi:hypothetical protein